MAVNRSRQDFWQGKKVLVTGHTGFKGSWLSVWLQKLGAQEVGYALTPPTTPSLFELAHVADGMTSIVGDVRDGEHLTAVMAEHQPEIVIHLAAQALVRTAYQDPIGTISTNVLGTANVLDAVRQMPVGDRPRVVLCITSDKCYRNLEWAWGYRETDELGGHDPYSGSKGAAELIIRAFRDSYFPPAKYTEHGVALASTRAGNVIGGGDWAKDRLIPDILNGVMAGKPVIIRSPHAIRPWQHVMEPLHGYMMLAEHLWDDPSYASAWNFGPSAQEAKPVSWIVDYVTKAWGEGARWELDAGPHPREDTYLKLDCSKATSKLGWRPKLTLETTLDWIVEWYRAYQDRSPEGDGMRAITEIQVTRFEAI